MSLFDELSRRTKELDSAPSFDNCKRVVLSVIKFLDPSIDDSDLNLFDLFTDDGRKLAANASWFIGDTVVKDHKATYQVFQQNNLNIDFKLFGVQNSSKRVISWAQAITPNFEDEPFYEDLNVGIDFIVPRSFDRVYVALSNNYVVRILELSGDLTATYAEIFSKWQTPLDYSNKKLVHTVLWESFDLQPLNRKFYEQISERFISLRQHLVANEIMSESDASQFANRLIGRVVFCWFIDKKKYINPNIEYFNSNKFSDDSDYYREKLERLFFEVLNKPLSQRVFEDHLTPYLNGGLFEERKEDLVGSNRITFPKNYFDVFFKILKSYNFTTDESTSQFQQVAIDPEMLGRIFENLLAEMSDDSGSHARKAKGAFYTPREVVDEMCRESLRNYLVSFFPNDQQIDQRLQQLLDGTDQEFQDQDHNWRRDWKPYKESIINALDNLKMIDPACGSGAFPMGMLQLLLRVYERLESKFNAADRKLTIVATNIYGVDIEPMAVEIARLRAWLSIVVDLDSTPDKVEPLPNLDFKFVCANSLMTLEQVHEGLDFGVDNGLDEQLATLRQSYYSSNTFDSKNQLKLQYKELIQSTEYMGYDKRTEQVIAFDPFQYSAPAKFFDSKYMFGLDGFDIVLGNPPYLGEKGNREVFASLKESSIFKRFYQGRADLLHYFFHLGLDLLKEGGILSFITTNYYPTATYGTNLRNDIKSRSRVVSVINFQEIKIFESALGQHNMITTLSRTDNPGHYLCKQVVAADKGSITQEELKNLIKGKSKNSVVGTLNSTDLFQGDMSYLRFVSGDGLETVLQKLSVAGSALGNLVTINQGLISGIDKFTASWRERFPDVKADEGKSVYVFSRDIEKFDHLRPWFKNSDIHNFITEKENRFEILWLGRGSPKPTQEELDYLRVFQPILEARREFQLGKRPWYELHWARDENLFTGPKIVNSYRTYDNAFAYNDSEFFGGADITFLKCDDLMSPNVFFVLGLLNSNLAYFWFYFRGKRKGEMLELKQVPVSEFPVARDSTIESEISRLSEVIYAKLSQDKYTDVTSEKIAIDNLVYQIYQLNPSEVQLIEEFCDSKKSIRQNAAEISEF